MRKANIILLSGPFWNKKHYRYTELLKEIYVSNSACSIRSRIPFSFLYEKKVGAYELRYLWIIHHA